jgi:hypothetical protein
MMNMSTGVTVVTVDVVWVWYCSAFDVALGQPPSLKVDDEPPAPLEPLGLSMNPLPPWDDVSPAPPPALSGVPPAPLPVPPLPLLGPGGGSDIPLDEHPREPRISESMAVVSKPLPRPKKLIMSRTAV